MFISKLSDKINAYDPFGEFRINGLKILFIIELMFLYYAICGVPTPYFYFFYLPITSFAAETVGRTLEEKYLFLFVTITGSAFSVLLFGVLSNYILLFSFFVFFYSVMIYQLAIHRLKNLLPTVPLILSLASYSMIYNPDDANMGLALRHGLISIVALLIMFGGLILFPKRYYLAIWRRAFSNLISHFTELASQLCENKAITVPVLPGIVIMERYSRMLSKRLKVYSVMKITLLTFELMMIFAYIAAFETHLDARARQCLHKYMGALKDALKQQQAVRFDPVDLAHLQDIDELNSLYRLILSWNYLCV